MSKGPDSVTSTTEPPAFMQPFLQGGMQNAAQLFNAGPEQLYPADRTVPFSDPTNLALNMQMQRAQQGSPVVGQAQQAVTDMMTAGPNPYLDEMFGQAAGQVGKALDTSLARSGRRVTGNEGVRAQQLGDLATNIYGGAYNQDQNRRLQAAGQAIPLAREDYFDIGQLGQVGQRVEGQAGNILQDQIARYQQTQQAPWDNLQRYMSTITGANMGSQQTQPVFNDPLSSGLGAALSGGALASMLGGPVAPFAIGAGLLGAFGG